jgi:Fe-S cluster assembly protein SufB
MSTDLKAPNEAEVGVGEYQFGFHDPVDKYIFTARKGIDRDIVSQISAIKTEPDWMREFRLEALEIFFKKPLPNWGGRLADLNFQDIHYYVRASANQEKNWEDVPDEGLREREPRLRSGRCGEIESRAAQPQNADTHERRIACGG